MIRNKKNIPIINSFDSSNYIYLDNCIIKYYKEYIYLDMDVIRIINENRFGISMRKYGK
jgi:hypothetical protein